MAYFTFISDTHGVHKVLTDKLTHGNFLIHSGDISSRGQEREVRDFLKWFNGLDNYDHKIFIAGNHDFLFERQPEKAREIVSEYENVIYLEDESVEIWGFKFYGTPWQPRFRDWAFNLMKGSEKLKVKFDKIPEDTDILLTHCPPQGILDRTMNNYKNVGSEHLLRKVLQVNPLIHTFGHIHEGYGERRFHDVQFLNSSNMTHRYFLDNDPINLEIDIITNEITFNGQTSETDRVR